MTTQARTPPEEPLRILPSHERVLRALGRYERLTAEQAQRLLLGKGSLTRAQTRLRELFDDGYVRRKSAGRQEPHGSGSLVYTLDRRGRAYLKNLGVDVPGRLRQSDEEEIATPFLRHSIKVVDVLILHELVCRADTRFSVGRMIGEREMKGRAVKVTMPGGRRRTVWPDAWVDLRIAHRGGEEQLCLAYEVDNGTEWQEAWRTKVQALLAYDSGPYERAFGADTPLTIVVVAPTIARRDQLRSWTEQELAQQRAGTKADLFLFGTMPEDLADAPPFFLAPRWYLLGRAVPLPLVERTW
jgi:hypothetical protein